MKKINYLLFPALLITLCFHNAYPQSTWIWQNPTVNGNTLNSIEFLNNNTGYSAGNNGTIIKTVNSGNTWITLPTSTSANINDLDFVDVNIGYVVGNSGLILKTINGGNSWDILTSGVNTTLWSVTFINTNTGYAAGTSGVILKTTDGGVTWIQQETPALDYLNSIYFVDLNTGYAVGALGAFIKTTNGGTNWTAYNLINLELLYDVYFLNENIGFVIDHVSQVHKTTDGGLNWIVTPLNTDVYPDLRSVYFLNSNTGYISGGNEWGSVIYKSTNAGENWVEQNSPFDDILYGIHFADVNIGYTSGTNGNMAKTTNGGQTWISLKNSVTSTILRDIHFPNSDTGYSIGSQTIVKTTNGGTNWIALNHGFSSLQMYSVYFLNGSTGFVGTEINRILKTTDGGASWQIINPTAPSLWNDIEFVNNITGYASGAGGKFVKTTDAGNSWFGMSTGISTNDLRSISFPEENTGYVSGTGSTLIKTINGGLNWAQQTVTGISIINGVDFIDINTGFAAGSNGKISKTINGGINWIPVSTSSTSDLQTIDMLDSITGYAAGFGGIVIKTTNGGDNWFSIFSSTTNAIYGMHFPTLNTGYISGFTGMILKTDDPGTFLTGTVRYEDNNQNVNSGRVMAIKLDSSTNEIIVLGSSQILTGGTYSIPNLPPTPCYIVAYPNSDIDFVPTYYPSSIDWHLATEIIPIGTTTNINILVYRIDDSPGSGLVRGGVFQNLRMDSGTIDYAIIYAKLNGQFKKYSTSISNGDYRINNLSLGIYEIIANRLGFENESYELNVNGGIDSLNIYLNPASGTQPKILNLTAFIQGFYNSSSHSAVGDTMRVYLRSGNSPYNVVDSAIGYISNTGASSFSFDNALDGVNYYIQLKHRNSLETWSASAQSFKNSVMTYDFSISSSQVYGNNSIQVDTSPLRFAIYNGDVNNDGVIDISDLGLIDMDVFNSVGGYVNSDLTGDNYVDLSDLSVADNNVFNYVSVRNPIVGYRP